MFLHAVEEGPANQSYGLQVAQLAGVPAAVIRAARRHLARLEEEGVGAGPQPDLFAAPAATPGPQEPPVLAALRAVDPDALTPREALELVFRLKELDR